MNAIQLGDAPNNAIQARAQGRELVEELIRKREVLERGLPGLESCYGTRGGRKVLVCSPEAAINIIRRELGEI